MTRIIGGTAGGRRLQAPRGSTTRPTTDRVREALFSAIESRLGSLQGLRFLDLYAGSGAVGFEAWSRGAGVVKFVDSDRRAASLIADNARQLGCRAAMVVTASVETTLRRTTAAPFDVVFLDPPYALGDAEVDAHLDALVEQEWIVPGGLVVIERSSRSAGPTWPPGWAAEAEKSYGETTLWYGLAPHRSRAEE